METALDATTAANFTNYNSLGLGLVWKLVLNLISGGSQWGHIYRNPGTARGRTREAVWTGGKQGRQAPGRGAGRQAAPGKVGGSGSGARRGSIGRARRQALRGATRDTAPGAGHGSAHTAATRRDWPCGAGAPAAGWEWPGRPASPRFPTRRRRPRPSHGGFAGEAATSPFDLVSIPAAWTPSTRPFDRDTGPSGDTARVTQSAAVCRHFPARASALHPNSRLCPTLTGAAIRRSA